MKIRNRQGTQPRTSMRRVIPVWCVAIGQVVMLSFCASAQDWTSWSGPTSNFIADPLEKGIASDQSSARLAWQSEDNTIPPGRSQAIRYACNEGKMPSGGMASPLVYKNRVYLYYLQTTGSEIDQSAYDQAKAKCLSGVTNETVFRSLWSKRANNVVICIDGANGKTIWKKSVSQGSYPTDWSKPRESNNSPVIADGKLVFFGSDGMLWAVDVETGATLWSTKPDCDGGYTAYQRAPALMAADGVVAFGGCTRNYKFNSLSGYDLATGLQKWIVLDVNGEQASPSVWRHNGEAHFVCGAGVGAYSAERPGRVSCINAKSGKVMWIDSSVAGNISGVTVNGDYLVANATGGLKKWQAPVQVGGFKLSLTGMQRLWVLPAKYSSNNGSDPAIIYNGHAYIRRAINITNNPDVSPSSLICVNMQSGQIVGEWSPGGEIGTEGYHMIVDGKLFEQVDGNHSDRENNLWVLNADPAHFRHFSTFKPSYPHTTAYEISMVFPISRGRLFARGNHTGRLYAYEMSGATAVARAPHAGPAGRGTGSGRLFDIRGRVAPSTSRAGYGPAVYVRTTGSSVRAEFRKQRE